MNKSFLLILFAYVLGNRLLYGQTFTRITAANNPVVNDQFESGGGSWADFNNDHYLDLFVPNGNLNNQNNSLHLNDRQGNFVKIVTGAVVMDGGSSIGGTWGDFNNDGRLDLFVTNRAALITITTAISICSSRIFSITGIFCTRTAVRPTTA